MQTATVKEATEDIRTFGQFSIAHLGAHFTAYGVRNMLVKTERGLAGLVLSGHDKHNVHVLVHSVQIKEVTLPK